RLRLRRPQPIAIQIEEQADGQKCGPLVAVDEWMVLRQAHAIAGRQVRKVRLPAVSREVLGPGQRRLEQALVANTFAATMLRQALRVQQEQCAAVDPAPAHFASW